MIHGRFLSISVVTLLSVTLLVAVVNVLVDPYGLFDLVRVEGVNQVKPMAGTRVRSVKPYQLLRADARVVIAGNSRPELGMDPASSCWSDEAVPVFNSAVPGIDVYQQARLVQTALLRGEVDRVYWGVDFLDFVASRHAQVTPWPWEGGEVDARLPVSAHGTANPRFAVQRLLDARDATLSLDAAVDSIVTLLVQADPTSVDRRADGFNPARDYLAIIDSEGQGVLFEQKNRELIRRLSVRNLGLFAPGTEWSREFESLRHVLALAQARQVSVDLFVNPYHADYLSAIELTGNWALFEQWKRQLVRVVDRFSNVRLWDFSGFDRYSVPSPVQEGERGRALEWFWEPAHYRAELGERMIARMTGVRCRTQDPRFGERIDTTNIEAHLLAQRGRKWLYRQTESGRWRMLSRTLEVAAAGGR